MGLEESVGPQGSLVGGGKGRCWDWEQLPGWLVWGELLGVQGDYPPGGGRARGLKIILSEWVGGCVQMFGRSG